MPQYTRIGWACGNFIILICKLPAILSDTANSNDPSQMTNAAKQFWDWFEANNHAYLFLNDIQGDEKERLLNNLLAELHKYCDKLFFEAGGHPDGTQELIISAEGNKEYFEKVEELISKAPQLDNWKFIPFIPARDADFQIDFEGVILKPGEMWFLPLEHPDDQSSIGIRVCMKNYELIKDKKFFMATIFKAIDTIVGEKVFATDIDFIEGSQLPDDPEEEGMIELAELPKYINWKKSKHLKT